MLRVLMIRNAALWRLSFSYYDHAASRIHWFLSISYLWLDSCPDVCKNVTMKILCEDIHVLVLLISDSSLLRGFRSVSISCLRKLPKVILIIVLDRNSLVSYSGNRMSKTNSCEYAPIFETVVGMVVKRSISSVNLVREYVEFHQSNAISFKWSDQFSKFHNRWEYHALLKLSVGIHPRHSSWSVLLVPSLLVVSLTLGRSGIPLSCHASDVHNLHDVDQCNVLLTYILVSPHSICTLKDHVLHISRHLVNRNPDVFSTRYKLLLFTIEYVHVSYLLMVSVWIAIQFGIVSTYITDEWIVRTHFLERSLKSNRRLHSSKNRQRRILWMIHISDAAYRLEISSAFGNLICDDLMTISSIKSSNHKNEWTASLWHPSAKIQNFVVNFFDISSCSLTVTSVTRPTNIFIYIYIYIYWGETSSRLISRGRQEFVRTRYYNLILVSSWS